MQIKGHFSHLTPMFNWRTKTFLAMKMTVFLLIAFFAQASATIYSQQITFSGKNVSLETVFSAVEKQTGFVVFYNYSAIQNANKITIDARGIPLETFLRECLENQPFSYTIENKTVLVTKAKPSSAGPSDRPSLLVNPPIDIKGRIVDENGEGVIASIIIKGTKQGTTSDLNGYFSLNGVTENSILVISATNIETREILFGSKADMGIITVKIKETSLNEVVLNKGYYTEKQKYSVGNIGKVTAKDIESQPVNNPLLALQGRVPGVEITQSTGMPGSGVTVQIQGRNSINKGNAPLYVIDGVPYPSLLLRSTNNILGSSSNIPGPLGGLSDIGTGSPLNFINPADIESMDILKDADATAIYGSRAANGAILITTKKGKAGKTVVNVNVQNGWGKVPRKLDLLNTQQYLELRKEGIKNDNIDLNAFPYNTDFYRTFLLADLYAYDSTRYTDWQKVLIGGTARYTDAQATISGGNEFTQILLGAGYHRETSVFPLDFSDQKNSLHFSINHQSTDRKFRTQLSGNYLMDNNKLPNADFTNAAMVLAPNAPALYNEDGTINWQPVVSGGTLVSTWENPLARLGQNFNYKVNNLLANAVLSYELFKGLNIKSSFGFNRLETDEFESYPLDFVNPETRPTSTRMALYGRSLLSSWIVEPQATYQIAIGKGKLEALVGGTLQRNNRERTQIRGIGYTSDQVMKDMLSAGTIEIQSTLAGFYKYNAFFGRLNYNWLDKYILNLTGRRDGSTRFGADNLFHTFGSVGGAWIFSKEPFMRNGLSFVNFGKLRASYGTTGSDQIEDYLFLPKYSAVSSNVPYGGYTGLAPTGLPNPKLQWEETQKLQFGLDMGLLNDRIVLNVNYYRNRSSNQLLPYLLPLVTGNSSIEAFNFPATVQNYGWEFSLSTSNIKSRDLSWSSSFNVTLPKNKLVAFPDIKNSAYASSLVVGEPITITKVYKFLGVNATTGLYEAADQHGNPTSNPNLFSDKTDWVNTAPVFYGGLTNNFRYRGFELDFLFQFVKQTGRNNYYGNLPGQFSNQPLWVLDRWKKTDDMADHQRAISGLVFAPVIAGSIVDNSDAAYTDASFIRLKNASLSWQLPDRWLKKAYVKQFRLYAQGQNLLTITHYKGLDPGSQSVSALPPLRVFTLGVQVRL